MFVETPAPSGLAAKKKSLIAAEQDRGDVARAREEWRSAQANMKAERLVFIDESGASTKMTRLYGRCPRGKRLVCAVPHGHWKTTTFLGALRHDGMTAPCVFDGPINGETFLEAAGANLRYLPPYSPDLNPIEQFFAKLKSLLRKAAARTLETLITAIAEALTRFTPQECTNFVANSGYRRQP